MPIIPRYDTISQGDIPVQKMPTPGVEMFPGYTLAKNAEKVAEAGTAVEGAAISHLMVQGRVKSTTLKAELNTRLEQAFEDAKAAPQEYVKGSTPDSELEAASEFPTTTLVPRSQSVAKAYQEKQDAIVKDIQTKASADGNPLTARYLTPAIARSTSLANIRMQRQTAAYQRDETLELAINSADSYTTQVRITPPPAATITDGGASIDPGTDTTYESMRHGISQVFEEVKMMGGESAAKADAARDKKLAKMDHGRAVQVMVSDPDSWNEASTKGRNGWEERLTPESFKKLNDNAHAIIAKREGSANQQRLDLWRKTEAAYLPDSRPGAKSPLTTARILQDVKDGTVDPEKARTVWLPLTDALTNGHWVSDGPTSVRILMESQRPDVNYPAFQRQVEGLTHIGGLSVDDATKALTHARAISDKRSDRGDQLGFHAYALVHQDMTMQLKTPPSLLGRAFDDTSDVTRGRASSDLAAVALKSGYNPEVIAKWKKDVLPSYAIQIQNNARDGVKSLVPTLPVSAPLVDPKTGFIEQDEIDRTAKRIFQLYNVDPAQYGALKKSGRIPAEMDRALKTLEDIESLTQYQREKNAKAAQ